MRALTIKRAKSFVASLVKMKVYVEDASGDTYIGNCLCRMLGTLKNGEEKTFEITEDQVKIYVIADMVSKDWCNDFYQLAAGSEDVTLTGKNKYNPAMGNGFIFDNNDNPQSNLNRKKSKRTGLIVLACAVILGFAIGFLGSTSPAAKAQKFTKENFSITLTQQFEEIDDGDFFACYDSRIAAVFVVKESFEEYPELKDYTLEKYAQEVLNSNSPDQQIKNEDGLCYFEYVWLNDETNQVFHYNAYIFQSEDAYWIVTITTPSDNYDDLKDKISTWAKSVVFQ